MKRLFILLITVVFMSGCTHALHNYNVSERYPVPRNAKVKEVMTMQEQFVILGFVTETNYVDKAYAEIQKLCPNGWVTGINTRFSTSHGFFSWKNKVRMTGYCISKG